MADLTVFLVSSVTLTSGNLTSSEDRFNKLAAYFTGLGLLSIKRFLISFGMGGGQPNINQEIIKTFHVAFPPLPEQQKIASILSNTDEKIQSYERYRQKLQRLKKSLMQKLLTGEVRVAV